MSATATTLVSFILIFLSSRLSARASVVGCDVCRDPGLPPALRKRCPANPRTEAWQKQPARNSRAVPFLHGIPADPIAPAQTVRFSTSTRRVVLSPSALTVGPSASRGNHTSSATAARRLANAPTCNRLPRDTLTPAAAITAASVPVAASGSLPSTRFQRPKPTTTTRTRCCRAQSFQTAADEQTRSIPTT